MKKWNEFIIQYEEDGKIVTIKMQTGASLAEVRREYSGMAQQEATGAVTKKLISIRRV